MKKEVLVLFLSLFLGQQAFSQNTINSAPPEKGNSGNASKPVAHPRPKSVMALWGAGATVGVADGEFQTTIIPSNAGFPYPANNWTAQSIAENGFTVMPGNAYWVNTATGISQGAYPLSGTPISSPSQANGAAIFDSDYMDNNGVQGAFGTGSSPSHHRGDLISPRIDLTGYTDSVLAIQFFCKWRNFFSTHSVSFSTDDGANWTDITTSDLLVVGPNEEIEGWITAVFPNATLGVANLSQCRIRFIFDGDYYYQTIDDVTIGVAPKHDLYIGMADINGGTFAEKSEQYKFTNNFSYPESQLSEFNFIFGGNVKNNGYQEVVTTDNATFEVRIEQDISGNWVPLYSQVEPIENLTLGSNGTIILDTLDDVSWAEVGDFRAVYKVSSPLDQNQANDSVFNYFSITPNDYASKVALDNGIPEATSPIFPGGTHDLFEFGSLFSFPTAGTETLQIDSLTYRYYVPNAYFGNDSIFVRLNVYEWTDGSGTGTTNGLPEDYSELAMVASGLDTLLNLTSMMGSYGASSVSVNDIFTSLPSIELLDDTYYYVSISLESGLNNLPNITSSNMIFIGVNDTYNYNLNMSLSSPANPVSLPNLIRIIQGGGTNMYYGFADNSVPSIGVHLSGYCEEAVTDFNISENYLQINCTDATGTTPSGGAITAWSWDFGDGNTSTQQNPIHTYSDSGTYVVCLTTYNNCGGSTTCDTIQVEKDFTELDENWMDLINVYPIPATGQITVDGIQFEDNFTIEIVDMTGRIIRKEQFEGQKSVSLDLSQELSGSYLLRIGNGEMKGARSIIILN